MGASRWQAHLSESSVSARRAVLVFVFALGTAVAVAAQPPVPAGAPPGPAPLSTNEQVSDAPAKAWSAFYGEKHDDAISLSEPLTKLSDRRFRWAAVEAARQLWNRLERFPDAPSTERAMYFYALMAVGSEDRARAEAACKRFLATYPDSIWFQHVRALLDRDAKESPPTERSER